MKISVNAKTLSKALEKAGIAVPGRSPMPVLECYLVSVNDWELTVRGSNLETEISSKIKLNIGSEDCSFVVNAALFRGIVDSLDGDIELNVSKEKLVIKGSAGKYNLSISDTKDFPEASIVERGTKIEIDGALLKSVLKHLDFCISTEDMRPAMCGVLFERTVEDFNLVATDGHRLARYTITDLKGSEFSAIIPRKAVSIFKNEKLIPDEIITLNFNKTHLTLKNGDDIYTTRLIGDRYPNYRVVIPVDNEIICKVKRDEILSAAKRMLLLSSREQNKLEITARKNKIELNLVNVDNSNAGQEQYDCEINGEIKIGFNAGYFTELLNNISNDKVILKMASATKAVIANGYEDNNYTLLLMPVRLD